MIIIELKDGNIISCNFIRFDDNKIVCNDENIIYVDDVKVIYTN